MPRNNTTLIALDWGTSSLRAWLFDRNGDVLDTRATDMGILHLPEGGFPAALQTVTEGWVTASTPILACGMIGSRNGWREVPYLDCPVSVADIAQAIDRAADIAIVPGLRVGGAFSDVMRGEEAQVVGALAVRPSLADGAVMILPGTHSKWAHVSSGRIVSFRTYMTGELFAVLTRHSILGRLPSDCESPESARDEAFARGVLAAREPEASLSAHLFSTRSLVLNDRLEPGAARDYLSGLLIGDEVRSGTGLLATQRDASTVLIGEPALTARYAKAFTLLGHHAPETLGNTAAAGLLNLARAAGLLET
ncbi:2-keto-3-deoxy-galactonokinase [Neoasaia chiangmaiensis NBRC 101099]|uniref:Uncharacterized protein n=1 Tax=Neoasaia chiangmaiensis TaxID=320497 RepID=A0A1U9KSU1_9PROT|nr:2-dehydro-3-deoxygalactonokinase [Neoasaia chiangmaiensis]AQS88730.1 hypothetical protein A0U93_13295 [Neoasaia chiangmaiensis]GBR40910.1 2-keto-3-deoxy-galactonokinase [Neoasaia chiangmaiensis NBRC 101099]GEN13689.1 2-dehydro-3-deoxygalactonokinase [Neoasaia chiangmaiensis]